MNIDDVIEMSVLSNMPDLENLLESSNLILGWQQIKEPTIKPLIELDVTQAQIKAHINQLVAHQIKLRSSYNRNAGFYERLLPRAQKIKPSSRVINFCEDFI